MFYVRSKNRIGCAYRVSSTYAEFPDEPDYGPECGLLFSREYISKLAPEFKSMLSGSMVATALPGFRGVCLFSEQKWEKVRTVFERLPNVDFEARRLQRVALGYATPLEASCPFVIPVTLQSYARLTGDDVLIVFEDDYAEIWSDQNVGDSLTPDLK